MEFFDWFRSSSSRKAKTEAFLANAITLVNSHNYDDAFEVAAVYLLLGLYAHRSKLANALKVNPNEVIVKSVFTLVI